MFNLVSERGWVVIDGDNYTFANDPPFFTELKKAMGWLEANQSQNRGMSRKQCFLVETYRVRSVPMTP